MKTGIWGLTMICAMSAHADLSYDYLEVGYANSSTDIAGIDIDSSDLALEGSVAFRSNFFAFGSYGSTDFDDADIDGSTLSIGAGYHTEGDTQYLARAAFVRSTVDTSFGDVSDNGFSFGGGARGLVSQNLE